VRRRKPSASGCQRRGRAPHSIQSEGSELQFETGISHRGAGLLKEKTRSLTQRELADDIYDRVPPVHIWEFPEDLAALYEP
jgi:hypothetical protein